MGRDSVGPTNNCHDMSPIDAWNNSGRRNPATGVLISRDRPTIVFLTVCKLNRASTLAQRFYHDALVNAWTEADSWLVGAYVILPDYIHLFCAPKDEEVEIESGLLSGNGNSDASAVRLGLDFNHAVSIMVCVATKTTIKNGNTFERILSGQGSPTTWRSGNIRRVKLPALVIGIRRLDRVSPHQDKRIHESST